MSTADFVPKRHIITAITNANRAIVTAANHGFTSTETVKINVPQSYGMDIGNIEVLIQVIDANTFSIDFDTTLLDPFVIPSLTTFVASEVVPISQETNNIA